jgi:cardiolipin synthase
MLLYYGLVLLGGILLFTALGHIVFRKRSSGSMISWMLFIIFMPYIAAPLYFLIGIRKRDPRHKKGYLHFPEIESHRSYQIDDTEHAIANILKKNGIPPATRANRFELITSHTGAYEQMIEAIDSARKTIDICTYVFAFDTMTEEMLLHLSVKAKEGVQVRLLIDTVGSFKARLNTKGFHALREAGGEVVFFTPILKHPFQSYINLRNHRKIYLFDNRLVLSGGMNLSNAYMGRADGSLRWQDLLYRLEGPAVYYFATIFNSDWNYATDRDTPVEKSEIIGHFEEESFVQVVPSGPDIPEDALYEALLNAIYSAKERIWIVTPYFVPDENILQALIIACHKGVDVKLITPRVSNHRIADLVRSPYMRELEEVGVDVVLYEGEMLHGKALLIDRVGGMVGSLNLDNRSLFLNYEVVTFVYSPVFIHDLEVWMEELMHSSGRGLAKAGKLREAVENMMKVVAPLI